MSGNGMGRVNAETIADKMPFEVVGRTVLIDDDRCQVCGVETGLGCGDCREEGGLCLNCECPNCARIAQEEEAEREAYERDKVAYWWVPWAILVTGIAIGVILRAFGVK